MKHTSLSTFIKKLFITLTTTTGFMATLLALPPVSAAETAEETAIQLTDYQQAAIGIQTQPAIAVHQIPLGPFNAYAQTALNKRFLLSTPVEGQIIALPKFHGTVQAGEVVAQLKSPSLLPLQQAYLETLVDLPVAEASLKRVQKLQKQGVASLKQLMESEAKVQKLKKAAKIQQQQLKLAGFSPDQIQKLQKQLKIQAPIISIQAPQTGFLHQTKVKLGERLAADAPIVQLIQIDPIILTVKVPVQIGKKLTLGQPAKIAHLPEMTGRIELIEQFTDPLTQSLEIHVEFDNTDNKIQPGTQYNLTFLMPAQPNTFKSPQTAISKMEAQTIIFIKNQQNYQIHPIQLATVYAGDAYFQTEQPLKVQLVTQGVVALKGMMEEKEEE